jgi:hypothetical protein
MRSDAISLVRYMTEDWMNCKECIEYKSPDFKEYVLMDDACEACLYGSLNELFKNNKPMRHYFQAISSKKKVVGKIN